MQFQKTLISFTKMVYTKKKYAFSLTLISSFILWYFVTKIVLTYNEKKNSTDRETLLKFEAEGQEFTKFLRSLEQFI